MVDEILTMMRGWGTFGQVFFLVVFASLLTLLALPIINGVSKFFTDTIPILLRGWPEGVEIVTDEDEESDEDGDADDEQKN
jgi:hypothetical protein